MPPGRVNDPPMSPAKIQSAIDGQIYVANLEPGSFQLGDLVVFKIQANGEAIDVFTADAVKKSDWDQEWDPVLADRPPMADSRPRWVTELARNNNRKNKPG